MPLVNWTDQYSLGIAAVDDDHRRLFELLHELHDVLEHGRGEELIGWTLVALTDYAKEHFAREEAVMRRLDYPRWRQHVDQHGSFVERLEELVGKHERGLPATATQETAQFLSEWLAEHILHSDQALAQFLRARPLGLMRRP